MDFIFDSIEKLYQGKIDYKLLKLCPKPKAVNNVTHIKRILCGCVMGIHYSKTYEMYRWAKNPKATSDVIDGVNVIEKPQYIHSAAGVFLLLTYPQLARSDSFVHGIPKEKHKIVLKLANDILMSDVEGIEFINNAENLVSSITEGKTVLIDAHDSSLSKK